MIYRIAISVENPLHVATVLAEIWNGSVLSLPPLPTSYAILPCVGYGTVVEVYPLDTEFVVSATEQAIDFFENNFSTPITTCGAISVPSSTRQIEAIADREGWYRLTHRFGLFEIVELWIENQYLLELVPGAITTPVVMTRSTELVTVE